MFWIGLTSEFYFVVLIMLVFDSVSSNIENILSNTLSSIFGNINEGTDICF